MAITWTDPNPFDAVSVPATFTIEMDNGGNSYLLSMKHFGVVATCSSKDKAKARAEDLLASVQSLPRVFLP